MRWFWSAWGVAVALLLLVVALIAKDLRDEVKRLRGLTMEKELPITERCAAAGRKAARLAREQEDPCPPGYRFVEVEAKHGPTERVHVIYEPDDSDEETPR